MKFFVVFAAVVAVAFATPSFWTLPQLSEAIDNPTTSSVLKPVLTHALDIYMDGVFHGHYQGPMHIKTAAGVGGPFTLSQLDAAIHDATVTSSIFKPYLENALNQMMSALVAGEEMTTINVQIPSFQLSYWSLNEIDAALSDAETNPALIPYLKNALDIVLEGLINGGHYSNIVIAVPAEVASPVIEPTPVDIVESGPETPVAPIAILEPAPEAPVEPIAVNPVAPTPVAPSPVAAPASSPLVEIIINIQQQQSNAPTPVVDRPTPSPVIVRPEPEQSIDASPIDLPEPELPHFIIDRPQPLETIPVNPIDVIAVNPPIVEPVPVNPIDIIAVHPIDPVPVNPIDIIAVQPIDPVPVNPIDIIAVHPL